jgi:hypothetical protein
VTWAGTQDAPAGQHRLRVEFAYDGCGWDKGADIALYVDGTHVGEGRVERTHPLSFSPDETTDVGRDTGAPVTTDYPSSEANAFAGEIEWASIDLGDDSRDHLIDPEDVLHIAMTTR